MKKQIRYGVFETNSSSVHSLTMCNGEDYKKWKDGKILYDKWNDCFITKDEAIEKLKKLKWNSGELWYPNVNWDNDDEVDKVFKKEKIKTYDEFFDDYDYDYETFVDFYTTPNGEEVVAFGYYGSDR